MAGKYLGDEPCRRQCRPWRLGGTMPMRPSRRARLHAVGALQNSVRRDLDTRMPCGAANRQREGEERSSKSRKVAKKKAARHSYRRRRVVGSCSR